MERIHIERRLRRAIVISMAMLTVQLLVGVAVNLYVAIPAVHPGAQAAEFFGGVVQGVAWAIAHGGVLLAAHAVVGLVLGLASIGVVVQARRLADRRLLVLSALALFGVVAAGFNGASFLNYGHDFSSLLMTAGLAISLGAYSGALYLHGSQEPPPAG